MSDLHLQWFRNYLSNRKQYIQFDGGQKTNYKTLKCGAPQRSILRPLVFLLYINDFSLLQIFLTLLGLLTTQINKEKTLFSSK